MPEVRSLLVEQIPRLRRYARALVGDPVQADDLVQDCLERAWRRLHLWEPGSDLRAWLFTVLHNLHVDAARKRARAPRIQSLDSGAADPSSLPAQEDNLEIHDLAKALARLPDGQRAVLLLIGLEGMSYAEAASVLGIPVGTVMSRLHRGREQLRILMSEDLSPVIERVE